MRKHIKVKINNYEFDAFSVSLRGNGEIEIVFPNNSEQDFDREWDILNSFSYPVNIDIDEYNMHCTVNRVFSFGSSLDNKHFRLDVKFEK